MAHKADIALVHIGGPHAGSTRIQTALSGARGPLAAEGALYPRSLGRTGHMRLAAAMTPGWRANGPRRMLGLTSYSALRRHRSALSRAFAEEVAATRPRIILISAEQLLADASPARLRRFLAPHAECVEIVACLRRQDQALTASWRNAVKLGAATEIRVTRPRRDPFDYAARLRPWVRSFGRGALHVAAYDPALDPAITLPARGGLRWRPAPAVANVSLGGAPLDFMQRLNALLPRYVDGRPNPLRGDIDAAMETLPDCLRTTSRNDVAGPDMRAIRRHFANSNSALSDLLRRDAPFFDDADAPDPAGEGLSVDAAMSIAAHLWSHKQAQVLRLRRFPAGGPAQGAAQAPRQSSPHQSKIARRCPSAARSSQSSL